MTFKIRFFLLLLMAMVISSACFAEGKSPCEKLMSSALQWKEGDFVETKTGFYYKDKGAIRFFGDNGKVTAAPIVLDTHHLGILRRQLGDARVEEILAAKNPEQEAAKALNELAQNEPVPNNIDELRKQTLQVPIEEEIPPKLVSRVVEHLQDEGYLVRGISDFVKMKKAALFEPPRHHINGPYVGLRAMFQGDDPQKPIWILKTVFLSVNTGSLTPTNILLASNRYKDHHYQLSTKVTKFVGEERVKVATKNYLKVVFDDETLETGLIYLLEDLTFGIRGCMRFDFTGAKSKDKVLMHFDYGTGSFLWLGYNM